MLASIFLACGIMQWLVWGCPAEPHVPVTNTIIQTEQMQQHTEQQRIQAGVERAAIQATAQAHNASVSADVNKYTQDALTERNLQMQVHASERLHAEERARTERQSNMIMLFVSIVITGGVVAVVWIWKGGNSSQLVSLPPIPEQLPTISSQRFIAAASSDNWQGWDVVEYQGREIGVKYLANETKMYQLEDRG